MALNPLKRKDTTSDEPSHWYKDQYQYMVVQRNVLAVLTLAALAASVLCVFFVMRVAKAKTVEPYVVQIDDKTGIVQLVEPIKRNEYAANEMIDRYFIAQYITGRESYNVSILRYNYNMVRVMSAVSVFNEFSRNASPNNPVSAAALLKNEGMRGVRIKSIAYIQNPPIPNSRDATTPTKIIQARVELRDTRASGQDVSENFVITISFEYAKLQLNEEERLLNPLGFTVTQYQIQREIV